MKHFIPAETIVEFLDDGSWSWFQFDGCVPVKASQQRLDHAGQMVVVDLDLLALVDQLFGKSYVAKCFDTTAGAAGQVQIEIDADTLSDRLVIAGKQVATSQTTGTFRFAVQVPSFAGGVPPPKDPTPFHAGTWRIRTPAAPRTEC